MSTITLYIAASLMDDMDSVMESNSEVDDPATAESVAAYYGATRTGRRWRLEFASEAGLRDFRADVEYRRQFHQPTRWSGTYDPDPNVRRAAERVLAAIDAMLGAAK